VARRAGLRVVAAAAVNEEEEDEVVEAAETRSERFLVCRGGLS
jgi:hypothetical protein